LPKLHEHGSIEPPPPLLDEGRKVIWDIRLGDCSLYVGEFPGTPLFSDDLPAENAILG